MSKKKPQAKSGIKWPTTGDVKLRALEKKAAGAIAKNRKASRKMKDLVRMDALTRLPMPSHSALSREIAEAHAAPKLVAGSAEAKADKENYDKTNDAWTQVNNIRGNTATMLAVPSMIAPLAKGELIQSIPKLEQAVFVRVCKVLSADTAEYVAIMNDIFSRHKGKTGNAVGFQEQELARYVFAEYVQVAELWMEVTLPVIEHMITLLQSGLSALAVDNIELATQISGAIGATVDGMTQAIAGAELTPKKD